jgi:uncharacterized protein (DUF2164 family)
MKKENTIKVTKEQRDEMIAAIKHYFLKNREEEIGDLQSRPDAGFHPGRISTGIL